MIKVFYDHQIFSLQKYGGISRYFTNLISGNTFQSVLPIIYSENIYLHLTDHVRNVKIKSHIPGIHLLNYFRNQFYSFIIKYSAAYDIYHPTYYDPTLSFIKRKNNVVITVYDMIHEIYKNQIPWYDPTRFFKSIAIRRATHIIAISKSTKNDLMRLLLIPSEKISVVYLSTDFNVSKRALGNFSINSNSYILYVGLRSGYKNFYNLLLASAPLFKQYIEMKLLCVGGGDFTEAENRTIKQLNLENKVIFKSASESELKEAYKNALIFVYPSKYEGFGIPILESFSQGCPVLCSNTSSLPEVAGNAAIYFDPNSIEDIRKNLMSVIQNESRRKKMADLGYKQLEKFSWKKTVSETNKVYEYVLSRSLPV